MHTQTATFCTLDEAPCRKEHMLQYVSKFLRHMMIDNGTDAIVHALKKSRVSFRHVFMAACIYRRCIKVYYEHLKDRQNCSFTTFETRIKKEHPRVFMEDNFVLFMIALVVGSKIIEDTVYSNHYWSELSLIPHTKISHGEKYVLALLDWNVEPQEEEFMEMVHSFEKICENTVLFILEAQGYLMRRMRECLATITQCVGWR